MIFPRYSEAFGPPFLMTSYQSDIIHRALDGFEIELPSWGFANTGTRFGKFHQPAAATTTAEKFADAAQVHRVTGICPTVALHVLWDLPNGAADCAAVERLASEHGLRAGSINPNVFQDQHYKYGSLTIPIRRFARSPWITSSRASQFKRAWAAAISRCGSPMDRTTLARRTSGIAGTGLKMG